MFLESTDASGSHKDFGLQIFCSEFSRNDEKNWFDFRSKKDNND